MTWRSVAARPSLLESEAAVSQDLEGLRQEMDAAIEATTAEAEAGKFEAEREAEALRRRVAALESELAAARQMSEVGTRIMCSRRVIHHCL
jgi:hypothetical protein